MSVVGSLALSALTPKVDYDEIRLEEKVGHGSYGVVYKAIWRNQLAAVKEFGAGAEHKAIETEVKQLSRVKHTNIIALYGIASNNQSTYLIMEYAEGGSLHNFLHGKVQPAYKLAHAMSWARQCAEGVAYLHAMTPKPLIHRDLKPLNLLLTNKGRHLKICDFGTVADKSTRMTNNRGSAAWMAPEVFEGSQYTEKCDIFSWSIVLWEVLSRKQPFKDVETTYSIMWKIHKGERPPLLVNLPKSIEDLMTACWETAPEKRPSMNYVVSVMNEISKDYHGADEPLEYTFINQQIVTNGSSMDALYDVSSTTDSGNDQHSNSNRSTQLTPTNTSSSSSSAATATATSNTSTTPTNVLDSNTQYNNSCSSGVFPLPAMASHLPQISVVSYNRWDAIPEEETDTDNTTNNSSGSNTNTNNTTNDTTTNALFNLSSSAEATRRLETIRNGMIQNACTPMAQLKLDVDDAGDNNSDHSGFGGLAKSDGKERLMVTDAKPTADTTTTTAIATTTTATTANHHDLTNNNNNSNNHNSNNNNTNNSSGINNNSNSNNNNNIDELVDIIDNDEDERQRCMDEDENDGTDQSLAEMLDPDLQPEPPIPNNPESQAIYREHRRMAKEYLRVDTNLYYAQDFKEKLIVQMDRTEREQKQEILSKIKDKEGLQSLYNSLQQQWERLPRQHTTPSSTTTTTTSTAHGNSNNTGVVTNNMVNGENISDDGWVVITSPQQQHQHQQQQQQQHNT